MDDQSTIITVVVTLVGALSSAKAWEYWQSSADRKAKQKRDGDAETHLYRDDLRDEVKRLRDELREVYKKREEEVRKLQDEIAQLREDLATMRTRVEYLEAENLELKKAKDSKEQ